MNATSAFASATLAHGRQHWHSGLELARDADWPQAARAFARAARLVPDDPLYWLNLANAQRHAGALPRAAAAAARCLRLEPADPLALRVLGECLLKLHRYDEAVAVFGRLEAAGHEEPDALLQHASALQSLGRQGEATTVLLRALALQPDLPRAHALLGDACRDMGLKREAVECLKTVLALEPGNLEMMSRLSFEKRHLCDWRGLAEDVDALRRTLAAAVPGQPRIAASFALLSLPLDPALQLVAARGEALAVAAGVQPLPPLRAAERAGRKPRLGWLSYDFRNHPVSQLLIEVLEALDPACFDLALYSTGPDDGSPLRARLAAAARFVDLRGLSDAQAAQRIRADGIDVLVDLMGHTRGQRLAILAARPAPVQAGFLGYPGSTGADFIDYLIGDPLVTPLELAANYSEKLAQMPLTLQPNGRGRPLPQPMARSAAGLPEGAFVMCTFNHTYKILPEAFDAWCSVMRELPHAVLWMRETNDQLHDNVRREAQARGIAADRIVFARPVSYADHFSRLALADVFVDSWPYNAHTTASDALWAGVPVVTHYGNAYASRVAASVLNAAGLGELALATVADWRHAVLALALEPGLLAAYRRHLGEQRLSLPLFDSAAYARALEALLLRMVGRWRAGLPCEHLPAAASF
jgi:predicted O-linked N-acetylglucosamine transferase (SPINDLY family)